MSPTARSLQLLRSEGYTVAVVEHWNHYARIRQDLFGCFDLLAVNTGTLAVQTTTASNLAARRKKLLASELLPKVLSAGWRCELHGWAMRGGRWQVKRELLTRSD